MPSTISLWTPYYYLENQNINYLVELPVGNKMYTALAGIYSKRNSSIAEAIAQALVSSV